MQKVSVLFGSLLEANYDSNNKLTHHLSQLGSTNSRKSALLTGGIGFLLLFLFLGPLCPIRIKMSFTGEILFLLLFLLLGPLCRIRIKMSDHDEWVQS